MPSPSHPSRERHLVGLIGRDILASRSPAIHEAEADALGLRLIYTLYDFTAQDRADDALAALIDAGRTLGFSGFNVTHPFKQAVVPLLDDLDDSASAVGAVNTIRLRDGKATGFNTDSSGFETAIAEDLSGAAFDRVIQLGAGGAGSATAFALMRHGTKLLSIYEPDDARAENLIARLGAQFDPGRIERITVLDGSIAAADGIVNATPIGMAGHDGVPLAAALLRSHHWVADVIYFPPETQLLREAKRVGCRTMNGIPMVVNQAARAFHIITGHTPDRQRMRDSLQVE